jgi:hypothetical protein
MKDTPPFRRNTGAFFMINARVGGAVHGAEGP